MRLFAALIALSTLFLFAPVANADDLDAQALQLYRELRCPVCQTALEESNTQIAMDMKGVIRQRLAAGESPQSIKDYFIDRYGETILVAPPRTMQNILAWTMPAGGLILGAGIIAVVLRRNKRSPEPEPEPESDPWLERLERELHEDPA